jgi:hypothetical protein
MYKTNIKQSKWDIFISPTPLVPQKLKGIGNNLRDFSKLKNILGNMIN